MKSIGEIKKQLLDHGEFITQLQLGEDGGAFFYALSPMCVFRVVFSYGKKWDHVSISLYRHLRCPTWEEMCIFKDFFWHDTETVVQYHPAKSRYVNNHPYCLHLWKPQTKHIPVPPKKFV